MIALLLITGIPYLKVHTANFATLANTVIGRDTETLCYVSQPGSN